MGCYQVIITMCGHQAGQPVIPQLTRRHLGTDSFFLCVTSGLKIADEYLNAEPGGQLADKRFIFIGFIAAQTEICMGNSHIEPFSVHEMNQ